MTLPQPPQSVVLMMASKEHRMWHYLWHGFRNNWERLTQDQQQRVLNVYPGWQPPRPALDANGKGMRDNDSGEDFLYMHRIMIMMVNGVLAKEGNPNYPWIQGWKKIPRPWDSDYPVPPVYSSGTGLDDLLKRLKTNDAFWQIFATGEEQFTDPDYLRSVTLGQLGSDLEWTTHNYIHGRWSAESPIGYRPDFLNISEEPLDEKWNQPEYNWLFDFYSSHVNPIFWKLHGWVDDRIEDWKRANRAYDYEWKGTWIGNPAPHGPHHHTALMGEPAEFDKLEQLAGILGSSGWRGFITIPE